MADTEGSSGLEVTVDRVPQSTEAAIALEEAPAQPMTQGVALPTSQLMDGAEANLASAGAGVRQAALDASGAGGGTSRSVSFAAPTSEAETSRSTSRTTSVDRSTSTSASNGLSGTQAQAGLTKGQIQSQTQSQTQLHNQNQNQSLNPFKSIADTFSDFMTRIRQGAQTSAAAEIAKKVPIGGSQAAQSSLSPSDLLFLQEVRDTFGVNPDLSREGITVDSVRNLVNNIDRSGGFSDENVQVMNDLRDLNVTQNMTLMSEDELNDRYLRSQQSRATSVSASRSYPLEMTGDPDTDLTRRTLNRVAEEEGLSGSSSGSSPSASTISAQSSAQASPGLSKGPSATSGASSKASSAALQEVSLSDVDMASYGLSGASEGSAMAEMAGGAAGEFAAEVPGAQAVAIAAEGVKQADGAGKRAVKETVNETTLV